MKYNKEELKKRVSIVDVLTYLNIKFDKRNGDSFKIHCPFHYANLGKEDSKSSCHIYTQDNKYHCYSCGADGDCISLVQKIENVPFQKALEILADIGGLSDNEEVRSRYVKTKENKKIGFLCAEHRKLLELEAQPLWINVRFTENKEYLQFPYRCVFMPDEKNEDLYVVQKCITEDTLLFTFETSKETYKEIVFNACKSKLEYWREVEKKCKNSNDLKMLRLTQKTISKIEEIKMYHSTIEKEIKNKNPFLDLID